MKPEASSSSISFPEPVHGIIKKQKENGEFKRKQNNGSSSHSSSSTCRHSNAFLELKKRPGKLTQEDVRCPICWCIMIEPITCPCKHSFCTKCFQKHVMDTSLNCPQCRTRLSVWCRSNLKNGNNLVDHRLWERIQLEFPEEVAARRRDEELGEESFTAVSLLLKFDDAKESGKEVTRDGVICPEFGNFLEDWQKILEPHEQDILTQRQKEEDASLSLAQQLQEAEEEEERRKMEADRLFAEQLQKQIAAEVNEWPNEMQKIQKLKILPAKSEVKRKVVHKSPGQRKKPSGKPITPSSSSVKRKMGKPNKSLAKVNESKDQLQITSFFYSPSQSSSDSGVVSAASTSVSLNHDEFDDNIMFTDDEEETFAANANPQCVSAAVANAIATLDTDMTINRNTSSAPNPPSYTLSALETSREIDYGKKEDSKSTEISIIEVLGSASSSEGSIEADVRSILFQIIAEVADNEVIINSSENLLTQTSGSTLHNGFQHSVPTPTAFQKCVEDLESTRSPSILFMEKSDTSQSETVLEFRNTPMPTPSMECVPFNSNASVGLINESEIVSRSQSSQLTDHEGIRSGNGEIEVAELTSDLPSPSLCRESDEESTEMSESFLAYQAWKDLEEKRKQEEADREYARALQRQFNLGLFAKGRNEPDAYSLRGWKKGKK